MNCETACRRYPFPRENSLMLQAAVDIAGKRPCDIKNHAVLHHPREQSP